MERRRLTRVQQRELTRNQLLDAAEHLIVRLGYSETSIEFIAEEAGFSRGAFYSNFSNKEAILRELFRRHMRRLESQLDRLRTRRPEQLLASVRDWLNKTYVNSDVSLLALEFNLFARRNSEFGEEYAEFQGHLGRKLGDLIQPHIAVSLYGFPPHTYGISDALITFSQGLQFRHLSVEKDWRRDEVIAAVGAFFDYWLSY